MIEVTKIPIEELVIGKIYELRSRNLLTGVYTGRGFIGIRLKFTDRYLFEEYLNDPPGSGTAIAIRELGQVDEGIELVEGFRDPSWRRNKPLYDVLDKYEHG